MDCVDCHNRATHVFNSPEELTDAALTQGKIDPGLPYIKKNALETLEVPYDDLEEAYRQIDSLNEYYQTNYPEIYSERKEVI